MFSERAPDADDVAWIVAAHEAAHVRPFMVAASPERVRASIERGDTHERIILDEHGERIGLWRAHREEPWLVNFRTLLVVRPGHGAGSWAMRRVLAWSFEPPEVRRMYLSVVEANQRARALYERFGFVHEGTEREAFAQRDGSYANLCTYGLLRREAEARTGALRSTR